MLTKFTPKCLENLNYSEQFIKTRTKFRNELRNNNLNSK